MHKENNLSKIIFQLQYSQHFFHNNIMNDLDVYNLLTYDFFFSKSH